MIKARAVYDLYRATPPTARGNGIQAAYWNGYNGLPCRYVRMSQAAAAWRAGRDNRRDADRNSTSH